MATPVFDTERERTILEHVREGMMVLDADNVELGTVDFVHLGEVSSEAADRGEAPATISSTTNATDALVENVRRVFGKDQLPPELRSRLLQHGFIYVNVPGLLSHNRYVLPDQITQVTSEGVVLKATKKELVKDE